MKEVNDKYKESIKLDTFSKNSKKNIQSSIINNRANFNQSSLVLHDSIKYYIKKNAMFK